MRLTAQLTTLEHNPVEYLAYSGPEILDEEDYALDDIELALDNGGLDEVGMMSSSDSVRH